MKILFHLEYQTTFGEELAVNIIKDGKTEQYKMGTLDGYHWTYELSKTAWRGTSPYGVDCRASSPGVYSAERITLYRVRPLD